MVAAINIAGERYGRLVAIERQPADGRQTRWSFNCDCGRQTVAYLSNVRSGQSISCGCEGSRATIGERSLKHGHGVGRRKSRTQLCWHNAKQRCFNPASDKYSRYGGRGITMCEEWASSFSAFLRDMGECPPGYTIERIDIDRGYEPGNCRWATKAEQAKNRSTNVFAELDGRRIPLKDFAAAAGVDYQRLHRRVRRGETPAEALAWIRRRDAR